MIEGLNPQQQEAVITTEGYVRVIAGAGSGKTKTLVNRYAYLIDALGISQNNILCVTFTNKAANEMRKRVKQLISSTTNDGYICTYHSFCVRVLREDIHHLHYPKNFMVLDVEDQKEILKEIYEELNLTIKFLKFEEVLKVIIDYKAKNIKEYVEYLTEPTKEIVIDDEMDNVKQVLFHYLKKQRKYFALDFQDLIYFTLYLYWNHSTVKEKWQDRMHYIQVDEFQDSNGSQLELINILSGKNRNLFVVGDPDQAIYTWRGANPEFLVDFDKTHKPCHTILLTENYRSTPEILDVGNILIKKNIMRIDKDLFTNNSSGPKAIYYHGKNEFEEVDYIVDKIKSYVNQSKANYSDFAIIYRSNFNSRFIEQGFMKNNIPYTLWSGFKFFERAEIKDTLAYLRMIIYADDISFLRTINNPKRSFGKVKLNFIKSKANQENLSYYEALLKYQDHPEMLKTNIRQYINVIEKYRDNYQDYLVSDLVRLVLDESGYDSALRLEGDQDRIDNISELLNSIVSMEREYGEQLYLDSYLQQISLYTDNDREDNRETVKLMTIHTAKGLEFPYVFLVSVNDGILPSKWSLQEGNKSKLEEERRLIYVGTTRAMKELYITESEGWAFRGDRKIPSRFLFDIPLELVEQKGKLDEELMKFAKELFENNNQTLEIIDSVLREQDKVEHLVFGEGVIQKVDNKAQKYIIYFEKLKANKPINISFKGLKKVIY
ncbi:UvrD-helicase domain-containing protein [Ureibacillus chungkukjangi]|uniref:ATP-dependent helicase n=1 Tax=Ureibacillus chungkukjangi TaxID=1202712 RepID=UPI00384AC97C